MTAIALRLGRLRRLVRRGLRQETGMAAVEFSLILPILITLWIGGVELTQALSLDRRLNNLASSIGDLVARSKVVTYADIDNIFDIAPGAMFPYSSTTLRMRVSAVQMDASGNGKITWSRAEGTGVAPYAVNANMNSTVPAALRTADTQVIMAEVFYTYTPTVGYVITGPFELDDRMYFVPRLISKVSLCDNDKANCQS